MIEQEGIRFTGLSAVDDKQERKRAHSGYGHGRDIMHAGPATPGNHVIHEYIALTDGVLDKPIHDSEIRHGIATSMVLLTPWLCKSSSNTMTFFPCLARNHAQITNAVERPTPPLIPKNVTLGMAASHLSPLCTD